MADLTARERIEAVQPHYAALLSIARQRTRSEADAEDAVQEALTRAGEADVHTPAALPQWVRTTLRRVCRDKYRTPSPKRRAKAHPPSDAVEGDHAEHVCNAAHASWVREVVARLPERPRVAAQVIMEGGTTSEVAARLNITYKAAEHVVAEAKRRLRHELGPDRAASLLFPLWLRRPRRAAFVAALCPVLLVVGARVATPDPRPVPPRSPSLSRTLANDGQGADSTQTGDSPSPVVRHQRPPLVAPPSPTPTSADERRWDAPHQPTPTALPVQPTTGRSGEAALPDEILWCVGHPVVSPRYVGCSASPSPSPSP